MKRVFYLTLILLCFPLVSLAEIPEQLITDFTPINGEIIMPIGNEYLINLDATNNLHKGDIFAILMEGEKILQPGTKQVVGTAERPKGFLQVTKIKSGYSYTKLLTEGLVPAKGDKIRRYFQVPTQFSGASNNSALMKKLKQALPQLSWIEPGNLTEAQLVFSLTSTQLRISDTTGSELKSYAYRSGQLIEQTLQTQKNDHFQWGEEPPESKTLLNQAVSNISKTIGFGGKDRRLENPGITQKLKLNDNFWIGPNLGENPVGLAVSDLDGDGQLETAIASEKKLEIFRIGKNKFIPVATIDFATGVHLLSLDVADADNNGTPEIYLSANIDTKLNSQVVEYKQGKYQTIIQGTPWFFRAVDLPREGHTLIAQAMGNAEKPFFGNPFRVIRKKNKLTRGTVFAVPAGSNLFSFIPINGANNDLLFAYISTGDYLYVKTPHGVPLWESPDHFGGTDSYFYNDNENGTSADELIQPVYVQQRLLSLPSGEILAVKNDGLRLLNRFRDFTKNQIVALKWNGVALQEIWSTPIQQGYLADFTVADADNDGQDELIMAIKYEQKNLLKKGKSNIVIYELNQEQENRDHQEPPKK